MLPHRPQLPILWCHRWGLDSPHQAYLLLDPSHLQCRLLEPFLLASPQQCPHRQCLPELEDMAPPRLAHQGQGTPDMDILILTHSHQVGCPIQGCLRCSWPIMALMA